MAGWADLLGGSGSIAETLLVWGILNQLLGDLLGPVQELVRQAVNSENPEVALSPADAADATVRGVLDAAAAASEAAKGGVNADRFKTMTRLAGEPIGLEQGLEAARRGFMPFGDEGIDTPSLERLVLQSRYYDMWLPVIEKLAEVPLTVGEAVDAALRGQAPYADMVNEAFASGVNAERFQILFDSAGRPPSLTELLELSRRNLIPKSGTGPDALTFQQGIFEGDEKNKWWQLLYDLAEYIPPPRTVTALLRTGSLTDTEAATYFGYAGMSPALQAAYVHSAKGEKLAGSKQLAESVVLNLYDAGGLTATEATTHLEAAGYAADDIGLLLELADLQRELRAVNSGVTRVGTLYVGHKITRTGAAGALDALGLTVTHRDQLLKEWDATAAANVRPLTEAQILSAWEYDILSESEALAELHNIGFTPFDAWVAISVKNKAPLGAAPPRGPAGPGTT